MSRIPKNVSNICHRREHVHGIIFASERNNCLGSIQNVHINVPRQWIRGRHNVEVRHGVTALDEFVHNVGTDKARPSNYAHVQVNTLPRADNAYSCSEAVMSDMAIAHPFGFPHFPMSIHLGRLEYRLEMTRNLVDLAA